MSLAHAIFVALISSFTTLSGGAGRTNLLRWSVFLGKTIGADYLQIVQLPRRCDAVTVISDNTFSQWNCHQLPYRHRCG